MSDKKVGSIWIDGPAQSKAEGDVYFIYGEGTNVVKIGRATAGSHVKGRLSDLQRCSPVRLTLEGVIPKGGDALEKRLHSVFGESRLWGEWFTVTPKLAKLIAAAKDGKVTAENVGTLLE